MRYEMAKWLSIIYCIHNSNVNKNNEDVENHFCKQIFLTVFDVVLLHISENTFRKLKVFKTLF